MKARIVVLAAAAALGIAMTGCGGGGGGGDDRLSKEDYIAQADEICQEADEAIEGLGEPSDPDALADYASKAAAIGEEQLGKLRALNPPEEIADQVARAYDLLGQQVELGKQIASAAANGDLATIDELVAQGTPLGDESDQIARDIGLKVCGSDSSS